MTSIDMFIRMDWNAVKSRQPLPLLKRPIEYAAFTSTGTEECYEHEDCVMMVQDIQYQHIMDGSPDIRYNFLICNNGEVFEGRGWKYEAPMRKKYAKHQGKCILIAFVGDYSEELPKEGLFGVAAGLLTSGVRMKYISPDFKMLKFVPEKPLNITIKDSTLTS